MEFQKKAYICLFLIGLLFGSLAIGTPIKSNHWILLSYTVSSEISIIDLITKPIILSFPTFLYMYRPLEALLCGALYNLFGFSDLAYHLVTSIFIGLFGVVSFKMLNTFFPKKEKISFIGALVSMITPPLFFASWFVAVIDIFSAVCLMISIILFLKLTEFEVYNKKAKNTIILFIIASLLTLFSKETSRLFLFLILGTIYMFIGRKKDKLKLQFKTLLILIPIILLTSLPFLQMDLPPRYKTDLGLESISFKVIHNFIQMSYPFFSSGILLLLLSSVIWFKPEKFNKNLKTFLIITGILFLFMINTPLISEFSFFGMVFVSPLFRITFMSFLFVLFLIIKSKVDKTDKRILSLIPLVVLLATILSTTFFPLSREDVATRAYIICLPFLFFMLFDSLLKFLKYIKDNSTKSIKIITFSFVSILLVMLIYFQISSMLNFLMETNARFYVEDEMKSQFKNYNLTDSLILFSDDIFPMFYMDLEEYGVKIENSTEFSFFNPNQKTFDIEDMEEEICLRTDSKYPPYDNIYIYFARYEPEIEDDKLKYFEGDFAWTEGETFRMLNPSDLTPSFWVSEFGLARTNQKLMYSKQTTIEKLLETKLIEPIYTSEKKYTQMERWIDESLFRINNEIPFSINYNFKGDIYKFNRDLLHCENIFREEEHKGQKFRWVYQDAEVNIKNEKSTKEEVKIRLVGSSFNKPRTIELILNNKFISSHELGIEWLGYEVITPTVELNPGPNILKIHSVDGCDIPWHIGEWDYDTRCISIALKNVEKMYLSEAYGGEYILGTGWYSLEEREGEEFRWTSANNTQITIFNDNTKNEKIKLSFTAWPFNEDRDLTIKLNGINMETFSFENWTRSNIVTDFFYIEPGENIIEFESSKDCDVPSEIGSWEDDERCLAFGISNLQRLSEEIISKKLWFKDGWYSREEYENISYFWMGDEATLTLYNNKDENENVKLFFSPTSFHKGRNLDIYINDKKVDSYEIKSKHMRFDEEIITPFFNMKPGENIIKFKSREGCDIPTEVDEWEDERCISMAFKNITKISFTDLINKQYIYDAGWYPEESFENRTFRWMSSESKISIFSEKDKEVGINFIILSFNNSRTLDIYVNGNLEESFDIFETDKEFSIPTLKLELEEGENVIEFKSQEGCNNPAEVGAWEDDERCISFLVRELKFKDL